MPRRTSVTTPLAHLVGPGKIKVINAHLAYSTGEDAPVRLDPRALRLVLCYGNIGVTDDAIALLWQHDVQVAWLSPNGSRCRGRMVASDSTRAALRSRQHTLFSRPEERFRLARDIVASKIESQIVATQHYRRQGVREGKVSLERLSNYRRNVDSIASIDALRGLEGAASAEWFRLLSVLIRPPWVFEKRARRPPPDPVNALLSLGYTWLLTRVIARCEAEGLEVYLGALHEYRAGRPSLACDLMEPFRVPAVDRWLIGVTNRNRIQIEEVSKNEEGFRLMPSAFGRMLQSWEENWLSQELATALDDQINKLVSEVAPAALDPNEPPAPDDL